MLALVRVILVALVYAALLHLRVPLVPPGFTSDVALQVSVNRAIMFDFDDAPFGSRSAFLRGELSVFSPALSNTLLSGKTVLLPCVELTDKAISELTSLPLTGLVVESCANTPTRDGSLSALLLRQAVEYPVYFLAEQTAHATEELHHWIAEQTKNEMPYRLVVKVGDSAHPVKPVKSLKPSLIVGRQRHESQQQEHSLYTPHLLISSHLDTLTTSPGSPTIWNAGSVAVATELWRRVFATPSSKSFTLTTLIGSTSRLGYAGTTAWLHEQKANAKKYGIAVSLDEMLSAQPADDTLFLHIPIPVANSTEGMRVTAAATSAAQAAGIKLEVIPCRDRYRYNDVSWEHEAFSHMRIPSFSLSTLRSHGPSQTAQLHQSNRAPVDIELLTKRVAFLHYFVEKFVGLPLHNEEEWKSESHRYLQGITSFAMNAVRSPSALDVTSDDVPNQEVFADELWKAMKAATAQKSTATRTVDMLLESELIAPKRTLYPSSTQTLTIYRGMVGRDKVICTVVSLSLVALYALSYFLSVYCRNDAVMANKKKA